jgi:hypothetical protein
MVGIGIQGVHVRYLNYRQQRQQSKTHHGDRWQSTQL